MSLKNRYPWRYSEKTEPRGRILFDALRPLLEKGDSFLDVDCGYSPMASHILDHGHTITGFDVDPGVIEHLKNTRPRGEWVELDDVDANFQGYTVLLFLGVTTALKTVYSETYLETAERLLDLNNPRVILVESADEADQELYNQVCKLLENTGRYVKKQEDGYDAGLEAASARHYSAWHLEWNYPYWAALFMAAEDEELDPLHDRFYRVAEKYLGYDLGLTVHLKIYDPRTKQTIQPELINKDELVKRLILEKPGKTLLNVGFWKGAFAFNMGLEGYLVDGMECYKRSVNNARMAQDTLPPEIASRFNFYYGFAEHLEKYPLYDIVVNHCLEHVRDPHQVMRQSLEHVKPGGYAYFTPPLKHGCDSPTHLHHWTEDELLELLPEGYSVNITKTKLQDKDATLNILVMEVGPC